MSQEQTSPVPPEGEWAPPSYESLDPPLNFHNPRSEPGEGEEEDEPPPPYSPGADNALDAPPDYYSLFGQIRNAQLESGNSFTFLSKVGLILLNTVGCTILLVVFMSVPITVLVLGAKFVGQCSLEPNIPIFLIVGGISGILKNLFLILENMSKRCPHRLYPRSRKKRKYLKYIWKIFNILFTLFMLAWIIAGSYWIYHIYNEVMRIDFGRSSSDGRSCSELLYKFSFGILTSSYILLVLMLCCTCCCSCCLKTNPHEEGEEEEENRSSHSRESSQELREDSESPRGSLLSSSEAEVTDQDLYIPPSDNHYWTHVGDGESSPSQRPNNGSVVQAHQPDSTGYGQDDYSSQEGTRWNTSDNLHLEEINLTEYTDSPILSPPHRPHAISFPSPSDLPETINNLYTTENQNGYSCTAV